MKRWNPHSRHSREGGNPLTLGKSWIPAFAGMTARYCFIAIALLFFPYLTQAAENDQNHWYQVEVIIFSQQDNDQAEVNRHDLMLSYPDNLITLVTKDEIPEQATKEEPFILLDKSERKLNPDAYSLNRTGVYKVLYHTAWRQPGFDSNNAPWVLIQGGKSVAGHTALEGSIRLVLSRFLHIEANIWHTRFDTGHAPSEQAPANPWPALPPQPEIPDRYPAFNSGNALFPAEPEPQVKTPYPPILDMAVIQQSRRLKLGELHYLDHPDMGILVLVSRYQLADLPVEPTF